MWYFLVNTINMSAKRNPSYLHILQNSIHFMKNISFFLLPLVSIISLSKYVGYFIIFS